jgi:hypothetical protein
MIFFFFFFAMFIFVLVIFSGGFCRLLTIFLVGSIFFKS